MIETLRTIKNSTDLALEGVQISSEWRDKALVSATITDATGKSLKFVGSYGSLVALVPDEPAKKSVHVVVGKVPVIGTEVSETFDTEYEAESRKNELERAGVIEGAEVKSAEVDIPF